jgi:Tol biopolymer transport system component
VRPAWFRPVPAMLVLVIWGPVPVCDAEASQELSPRVVFNNKGPGASQAVMAPKGTPRTVDFETDEGTEISLDVSPDGKWIAFDLLGQIYRIAATGGVARCLTQASGVALNYHPRFSPDGTRIAFISDRLGQANVWTMGADGSSAQAIYLDEEHRYATPVWARDGKSVFATRLAPTPGQGWHRRSASIWQLSVKGMPKPILESSSAEFYVSSSSPDGHRLYFYTSIMSREGRSILESGFVIKALELSTGLTTSLLPSPVTTGADANAQTREGGAGAPASRQAYDSGGIAIAPADILPMPSPDGRFIAFARAQNAPPMSYRGHLYGHSTALFVLTLKDGTLRKVAAPITKDLTNAHAHYSDTFLPGFAWTPDSQAIVIQVGGKISRVAVSGEGAAATNGTIPFHARVLRTISEQARRKSGLDPDQAVPVRFIQWPTASPDGSQLVFVALGKLWIMDLPAGKPRPLTDDPGPDLQFTPAWSPDGRHIAFATWNDRDRGHIWSLDVDTGKKARLTLSAGEFIWPTWAVAGESIMAVQGPGTGDIRDAWNTSTGWRLVRVTGAGAPDELTQVGTPWQPLQMGADGRTYFTARADGSASSRAQLPYPDATSLELAGWSVLSVDAAGASIHTEIKFPAGPAESSVPVVSADAQFVAYQSDYQLFVVPINLGDRSASPMYVDPDPNSRRAGQQRVDDHGGTYLRWHDAHTLEFAAGSDYVTFDVLTGSRHTVHVALAFRRDLAPGIIALTNAQIITMEGNLVIKRGTVVVNNGRIACVGECDVKRADHMMDLAGKTLIPGLIDVHEHIAGEDSGIVPLRRPASRVDLAYGITTFVDPAVSSSTLFPLAEMTEAGRIVGPRALGSADAVFGSVGGPNGGPAVLVGPLVNISSEKDAEYEVGRRVSWGAVTLKNFRQTDRRQQQWLIDAARHHGVSVTAEGSSLLGDLGMVMDGQTGWEHFLPALPIYDDVSRFFGLAAATYSPTLSVAGFPDGAMFFYRPRANLPKDLKYARLASPDLLAHVAPRDATQPPLEEFSFPIQAEAVKDIVHAGGYATVGAHGENPGVGTHWEIWAYATAMKPLEALRMATWNGARFVGIERDVGSISVGKLADIVILNADPLQHIESTTDIAYVMKSGHLYDPMNLQESALTLSTSESGGR